MIPVGQHWRSGHDVSHVGVVEGDLTISAASAKLLGSVIVNSIIIDYKVERE